MRVGHSRVPHPCATKHCCFVRLACLIHAASVRSEPGSNSPIKKSNRLPCGCCCFLSGKIDSFYCVTTVVSHEPKSVKSQTIDSGSSHYSTLFKEHPRHSAKSPCTVPFHAHEHIKAPGDLDRSLYRDGSRPPRLIQRTAGLALPQSRRRSDVAPKSDSAV